MNRMLFAAVVLAFAFSALEISRLHAEGDSAPPATAPSSHGASDSTSQPASSPAATMPAEITAAQARQIAEATLKARKMDMSKHQYLGTTKGELPGGKKCWMVAYVPKPPPQVPGAPVAMISGGQIIVRVAIDTGEVSMLMGQ